MLHRSRWFLSLLFIVCGCSGKGGPPAARSDDATLQSLEVSAGTLSPAFSPTTTRYTMQVPPGTTSFTVTATAHDANARSLAVRQDSQAFVPLTSGVASGALTAPAIGKSSLISLRVTAEDESTVDSVLLVTQAAPVLSNDTALAALTVSAGALSPAFASTTLRYSVVVPTGTTSLTVTPAARAVKASISVRRDQGSFVPVATGAASPALTVPATITVRVTAEDGTTADSVLTVTEASASTDFTIYAIGDSTMADYDPAVYPDQRGWGQMFPQFLVGGGVTFVNAAKNGRSSKSFAVEGSWAAVQSKLKPGDVVLIQFAHNDEKDNGLEGAGGIGTEPFGAFQVYLGKYVDETRAAGASPILVTPVVRRSFSGPTLTPKGAHDLTGVGDPSLPVTQDLNYVEAMKQVATAKSCPLIDLTASTRTLVEQFGPTDSKAILYVSADDTHLQPLGATLFAQLAVQALIAQNLLTGHLNPAADLIISPASLDFGSQYLTTTRDKAVSVTGLALTPEAGDVTISAPDGFLVSAAASGAFQPTLTLPYTGGRLAPTTVFVRFAPTVAQRYADAVKVTVATGTPKDVAVRGLGLSQPTGGVESSATYSLVADDSCVATGFATCEKESFAGLYVKAYSIPNPKDATTPWTPAPPTNTVLQRVSILGDSWAGSEIDLVPTRYVQFAVSPAAGKTWTLDTISFWAGAAGGSNLAYRVQYAKLADFSDAVTLLDMPSNVSYAMMLQTFTPVVTLATGETLLVRVFPWYKGASATGKYLCLQTVTVHGTAQ